MKKISKDKAIVHKKSAMAKIEAYIDHLINTNTNTADKFCYWLEEYATFLNYEHQFVPQKLKRYKRGEFVKANLGFNIGSEEGGLHYCVVIDKNNNLSSPVITVVPLTSLKGARDTSKMRTGEVFIGNDFYLHMEDKRQKTLNLITEITEKLSCDEENAEKHLTEINDITVQLKNLVQEIAKMKSGSIALVGQITTISKIRIYNPKNKHDVLANIRLSPYILDKIDSEIDRCFIGKA